MHGARTASGERFDEEDLTAAHPTLPFGSRVLVTNLANGRSVTVRINDRGPHVRGRMIDLSRAAARRLGMLRRGTARVRIQVLGHPEATSVTRARSRGPVRRRRGAPQQATRPRASPPGR
jgi:rare lipoprotein A